MKLSTLRPRPAAVIATGALVIALGGTSYAAAKISGSQIKKHSIAGNRLKHNTVTGSQVKESTLGTVPHARSANTATSAGHATSASNAAHASTADSATTADSVNGSVVHAFSVNTANNETSTVNLPGVTIYAECPNHLSNVDMNSDGTTGQSFVIQGNDGTAGTFLGVGPSLGTNTSAALSPNTGSNGAGTAVITKGTSAVLTITYSYTENSDGSCSFSGTAISHSS
jgi:hypothetical protein